ncbi:hypothetical protein BT69DRAFT_554344 [Atractiella rhizophila]|nr:hypothetical protein BT69DRAFT_554344 [Atractiella rhizophila]
MHAMCRGGQERASKGEREASKARCERRDSSPPHRFETREQCEGSVGCKKETGQRRPAPVSIPAPIYPPFPASRTPAPLAPTILVPRFRATLAIRPPMLLQQLLCPPK